MEWGYLLDPLSSVMVLVVTFVRKDKILVVAAGALALALMAIVLYPSFDAGPSAGMAPRPQAILAGVLLLVGAGGAMLATRETD